jgi:hypothetical protein
MVKLRLARVHTVKLKLSEITLRSPMSDIIIYLVHRQNGQISNRQNGQIADLSKC